MITRDFDLWITQGHTKRLVFNANQYDQGETWRFRILGADGNPIVPTTAAIIGQKKDGHAILVQGTVSDGKVVITETEQMTACAGLTEFELLLNGETHGTANFTVQVEKRPGDDADLSDSDLSLIQDAVDAAEVIVEVIGDGDPSEVIGEHVDAWLDNHPEATTTVEDGAITAPKINSTLWDKLLVSEEASGAVASFDDGADDVPVSSLKVALEPIQLGSGDPSPSNIRPIIASNGFNLLELSNATNPNRSSFSYSVETAEEVTASKTASGGVFVARYVLHIPSDGNYAITSSGLTNFYVYSDELWGTQVYGNKNTPTTLSFTAGTYVLGFFTSVVAGTTVSVKNPMVSAIASASYQPYQGIMVMVVASDENLFDKENATLGYRLGTDGYTFADSAFYSSPHIGVTVGTTYYKNSPSTGAYHRFFTYNANKVPVRKVDDSNSITIESGEAYVRFCGYISEIATACLSTTDIVQTYYPYTLGQSVYGGTVDLATGVLTVTHGYVDMGSLTWTLNAQYNNLWTSNTGVQSKPTALLLSDTPFNDITLNSTQLGSHSNAPYNVWVRNGSTTIQPSGIGVYELATPTTVQLTPQEVKTLLGYNNISADTGEVEVIYHADTKLYVDKMTAVDNAIIAPTEADFVATRNYTVNDLVIVNDTLYKVTANIASGSAITPNSNVQQTTLGALIKALS